MRAFKWGTTWPCMSRGCKTAGPQSWARPGIEPGPPKDRRFQYVTREYGFSPKFGKFFFAKNAAVWQPLEIQRLIIPHWKGLITGYCLVRLSRAWQCFLGLPRPFKVPLLYFIYRRSYVELWTRLYRAWPRPTTASCENCKWILLIYLLKLSPQLSRVRIPDF